MKNNIQFLLYGFIVLFVFACSDDDGLDRVDLGEPTNISADFTIEQNNSGNVTVFPSAEGANYFTVDFGDGSEPSEEFAVGENVEHTYEEGTYEVVITARNLARTTAQATQTFVVSFLPPENLEVTITKSQNNPFLVNVEATADNAAAFDVFFGEDDNETATPMMIGETVSHEYSTIGTYTITVVALSGGEATTTYSETVEIVDPLVLPITFESETVDYTFYNFGGGEGAGVPLVNNPDPNDINNSATVASYTKPSGSETWAGTSVTLNGNIDFSSTTYIAMDVYSPAVGTPVLFKVENSENSDVAAEIAVMTTVADEWETLVFDLSAIDPSQEYSVIALFFNNENTGTGETYYFDNVRLANPTIVELPLTFEGNANAYQFMEFGGAPVNIEANPDMGDANASETVAKLLKVSGSDAYAGAYIDLDNPVDFNEDSQLALKVWSPQANIPVILKFEDPSDGSIATEAMTTVTTANQWETVVFDFSGADASQNWQRGVFFFDAGNPGTGAEYYFDDLSYAGSQPVSQPIMPLTFESASVDYTWMDFGGAVSQVINNPDESGINTSSKVTEMVKTNGAETWAGSNMILDGAIDFSESQTFSMKTWSPLNGAIVLLKLESTTSSDEIEVQATTTAINQWEELTFDFSGAENLQNLDVISVFMNFNETGQGNTYYFDDIQLVN